MGPSSYPTTLRNTNDYRNISSGFVTSTHHRLSENFTGRERLIFAITDDDVETFIKLQVPIEEI